MPPTKDIISDKTPSSSSKTLSEPLLRRPVASNDPTFSEQPTSSWSMIKTFLKLAVPASITSLLNIAGYQVTQFVFAGTL